MLKDLEKHKLTIFILIIVSILLFVLFNWKYSERLELFAFDQRLKLLAKVFQKNADPNIIIVAIDDRTIDYAKKYSQQGLGRFPWPRPAYSKVIKFLHQCKTKAIILDVALEGQAPEYKNPSFNDIKFFEDIKKIDNLFIVQKIGTSIKEFKDFLVFINRKNPQLAMLIEKQYNSGIIGFLKFLQNNNLAPKAQNIINKLINKNNVETNLNLIPNETIAKIYMMKFPIYMEQLYYIVAGIGINNNNQDLDHVSRREVPIYLYNDKFIFSMAMEVFDFIKRVENPKYSFFKDKIKIQTKDNVKTIHIDNNASFYFNWREKAVITDKDKQNGIRIIPEEMHYKTIPFIATYFPDQFKLNPEIFKDKIVLIGPTADSFRDYYQVPNDDNGVFFGIELIATALDNLLNDNQFIVKASKLENIILLLASFLAVPCFFYLYLKKNSLVLLGFSFVSLLLIILGFNLLQFIVNYRWYDIVNPIILTVLTMILCGITIYLIEKDKRSFMENTFSKYVSPQVYKSLVSNYKNVDLSSSRKNVTVLFSDIRGFTSFVETSSAEEVTEYMNEFFTEMVEVILKNNGTIDKFIGDAIMAFWGAPLSMEEHAFAAAKTAIEMLEAMNKLNNKWVLQGKRELNIGIGLNSGIVLVGNFGSPKLMDYTVMGDTVNLGSRIESLNKEEKTSILISAYTYQQIKDKVNVRIIGPKKIKGKSEEVVIYELLSLKNQAK